MIRRHPPPRKKKSKNTNNFAERGLTQKARRDTSTLASKRLRVSCVPLIRFDPHGQIDAKPVVTNGLGAHRRVYLHT